MTQPAPEPLSPEDLAVLERRAERLRQAPTRDEADEQVLWVAEVQVGVDRYAVPLASLRAAVPLQSVTPVPLSQPDVLGILRFQGQIVCAYSLAALLGTSGWQQDPAVLVVVEAGGELVAFDCEQVPKPVPLPLARVEEARARGDGASLLVATRGGEAVRLVDLARVLEARRGARRAP